MHGKLAAIKNIIWALGIILCLLALLVGFLFAAFSKYDGSGQIDKGTQISKSEASDTPAVAPLTGTGDLRKLPETGDAGQSYIDSLTFLCDSTLIGLRDYGLLAAGSATTQVWGSQAGNIPVSSLSECTIRFPGDGSNKTAADAASATKPAILVVSLGSDGLPDATEEGFINGYTALLNAIHAASPETVIICCSIPGVTVTYSGADGLTSTMTNKANDWIRHVCEDTGVYYADTADAITDQAGGLLNDYAAANGKTLNSAALNEILSYLRTHALP